MKAKTIKNTMISSKYAMRLQLFGGGEPTPTPEPTPQPAPEPTPEPTPTPDDKITLTAAELEAKLQAEADKRVTGALKTAKEKWEVEFKTKLENEKAEAARLAKLSAEEREKELIKKEREQYEAKMKADKEELEKEKQAFKKAQLQSQTVKELATKNLPVEFADMVLGTDAESTFENIKNFETTWQQAIEKAVNQRLNTDTAPKAKQTPLVVDELEALREKALQSGKVEDRVAYANKKAELNKK